MNATQAAIRAGYSEKTSSETGYENLRKPHIADAIAAARSDRSKRTEITQDMVIAELAKIGFADIRKAVNWGRSPVSEGGENDDPNGLRMYPVELVASEDIDDNTAAAVSEVSLTQAGIKIKMYDKRAALESLLRHTSSNPSEDDTPSVNINITTERPVKDIRVTRSKT